jgi:hypothetical protein
MRTLTADRSMPNTGGWQDRHDAAIARPRITNGELPMVHLLTAWKEYAEQLAEDIGAINKNATWPNDCIDWEKAADQLKQDYTEVDFDGVAYWIR